MEEYRLDNPPTDCISCVRFSKASNLLIASSWDRTVSLYDTDKCKLLSRFENKAAVLSCDMINADIICLGGLDCEVKLYDFHKKQERLLGKHEAAVSCVIYVELLQCVISGSWDKSVKIWDIREGATQNPIYMLPQSTKVYSMDVSRDMKLFLALDNRQIVAYDLSNISIVLLNRECLLKYNTRSIHSLLNGTGFIVSSIEGRVGVEYLVEEETNKPFSFRCHRQTDSYGNELIYPVNAIAVHPIYGSFATGGADGSVSIWDAVAKKRLASFSDYSPGVACLAFNRDGTKLVIACSYTFEQGTAVMGLPNILCIRSIKPVDVMPKAMSS